MLSGMLLGSGIPSQTSVIQSKDSADGFSGNEPAADPDVDAIESVVDDLGAVRT